MRATADRFTCPAGLHERGQKFVATKPCTACRATEDLAADAEFLHTLEPSLDRDTAVAVIETVTSTRQHLGELHTWLRDEPDPLRSGTSSAPKVAQRLLAELDRRGVPVALPRCLRCGGAKTLVAVVTAAGCVSTATTTTEPSPAPAAGGPGRSAPERPTGGPCASGAAPRTPTAGDPAGAAARPPPSSP